MRSRCDFVVPRRARRRQLRFQVCGLALILALLTALIVLNPGGPGPAGDEDAGTAPGSTATVHADSTRGEAP